MVRSRSLTTIYTDGMTSMAALPLAMMSPVCFFTCQEAPFSMVMVGPS